MQSNLHPTQNKILQLSTTQDLSKLSLRDIGALINESHPQTIKYHIQKLEEKGLIDFSGKHQGNILKKLKQFSANAKSSLVSVPILGQVSCGAATQIAEVSPDGAIKVSSSIVNNKKEVYALRAVGNSMNAANVNGQTINSGDYVLVDGSVNAPSNGDYVVSIIDGAANAKKFQYYPATSRIGLISESTESFEPIIIDSKDADNYLVAGRIFDVVKL